MAIGNALWRGVGACSLMAVARGMVLKAGASSVPKPRSFAERMKKLQVGASLLVNSRSFEDAIQAMTTWCETCGWVGAAGLPWPNRIACVGSGIATGCWHCSRVGFGIKNEKETWSL